MYDGPEEGGTPGTSDRSRPNAARAEAPANGARAKSPASRLRRPLLAILAMVAAVAVIAGANQLWRYLTSFESTDDAQIEGYIDPVSSRVNGTVVRVTVDDNQSVKTGEILVQLDPRDNQVAAEQARANLVQAEAQVNVARQNYAAAQAQLRQAEAADVRAQHDARRYRALLDEKVASEEQYDQYVSAAAVSAATVEADRASMGGAQRMIASKQADVLASRAMLDQALLNLSYTDIKAPADGIVGKRTVQLGQRVEPGEQLLALTQIDRVWVTANFKETQLERMRPGQRVTIHIDAFSRGFKGRVESLPGASGAKYSLLPPENATGNYVKIVQRLPVRIRFDEGQPGIERLRPGMSVEPKVWIR
jgi:membrane fusion protein (multidrug efflux system)